ncbi:transcription intermediary factor 1-beta-like [Mercenaria mercenaria]|uniref:transcription intermediary factor 1-beta-like n=1 Tax=Mercenaria mercenaria TaxID=6596 RepID=UPI00234E3AD2|nr:transcription intermediary factor 1-beta-like [Mercenaria mercenaria]
MATGGSFSRTLEGGHEPFYDFSCTPCENEGKNMEAVRYCEECFVYMCDSCVRGHNRFPLHTRHQLLDQSQFGKVAQTKLVSFPTKRCLKHPGEIINIYCGDHDVVCCSSCKVLEHSNCAKTKHLIDAAKGIQKSKEYQTIKKETRALLNDAVKVLADRKADISRIENERKDVKKIIADFRKKVNKCFDDLEEKALDALHDKTENIVSSCEQDTKDLTVMKTTAEDMLKQLESFKGDNECDLFVQVKSDKTFLSNAMQEILNISKKVEKDAINFRIDPKIEPYLSSLEGLGSFTDIPMNASHLSPVAIDRHERHPRAFTSSSQTSRDNRAPLPIYKTQLYGKFDVKEKSDPAVCEISDICQLPNGTFLIADYNNKKLKRLDKSYKLLDSLRLPDSPFSICNVGSDEVAVSLCSAEKVQYISVKKKLTLKRSFSTGDYCKGMVYVDDKLYVGCGKDIEDPPLCCIEVYNNAGQLYHSISGLSYVPKYITVTDDGQHLLVTSCQSDDITMMDLTGNVVNTFSNRDLGDPSGICTDGKGQVFICDTTVVQLEPKQQKIDVILGEKDGIKESIAICYDRKQSRLLISC